MQKILFVSSSQYGYNSGMFYYTQHLKKDFEVTFIGYELGKKQIPSEGVQTHHITYKGGISTKFFMIREVFELHKKNHYDFIMVFYFPGSSLLLLNIRQREVSIDIRTSAILIEKPLNEA